jgi:hypothetical protein
MRVRDIVAAVAASIVFAQSAAAQTTDADMQRALGEVAGELEVCSVYFLVGSACIKDQRPDLAETYRAASDKVADMAISSGRAVGVSDKAYAAQASLYTDAMMKAMGGNCTNIAVLLQRYSNFCKRLAEDVDPRLKEWVACARARRETCDGPGLP